MDLMDEKDLRRGFIYLASLKFLAQIFAVAMLAAGIGFTGLAVSRSRLDYNSEGRYFDSESSVVYHQQAVETCGLVGGIGIAIGLVMLAVTRRARPLKSGR